MHILSIEDIELMVHMIQLQQPITHRDAPAVRIDNLVRMGYLRPLAGALVLTELGQRTAMSLQAKSYVPAKAPAASPAALTTDAAGDSGAAHDAPQDAEPAAEAAQ